MFDGSDLVTELDQAADSSYILDAPVVTGGPPNAIGNPNTTCGDWQNTGGADFGGDADTIASPPLWNGTGFGCDTTMAMLCRAVGGRVDRRVLVS